MSSSPPLVSASLSPRNSGRSAIFGDSEMANLIRAFDWSTTPVGPIEEWEDVLLTTVNVMLASRHAMFLFWGDELVQFYNDAYRATFDDTQHPLALGHQGRKFWNTIWHIIGPQIDSVLRGEGILVEDLFFENRYTASHRETYWTYSYTPVRNIHGVIRGTFVVCTDTTEAVLARNRVAEEKKRLANLFEQAPAFFAVLRGPDHTFELTNRGYQELIGNRDVIGKPLEQALPEAYPQGFGRLLDEVYETGNPYVGRATPVELYRSSASTTELRYLDFIYQPMRDMDGSISSILVFGVDVTEGRRATQMLLQTEKLTAVGQMASTIAHEINNPLEAVTNLLYLARESAILPEVQSYILTAEEELKRVSAIASQTLRFHRQLTRASWVESEALFESSLAVYTRRIANSYVQVVRGPWSRRSLFCYEGEIRQVINNLIGNAVDAMANGGKLFVRSHHVTDWRDGSQGLRLTVADTGGGISPQTLSHIFEPFFTTKGNLGTGLGLWVTREIIERHHGRIRIRSSQAPHRHGTVFTIFLPFDGITR
ncbi:MAG TPA: ATP-binding protein [Edaphobacter sp.]|nr:ATP-binding protein [Edaphobacter sp.]